jgi:hypothetical protein
MGFLPQTEAGMPIKEIGRKHGFSDASFCKCRSKYGGMDSLSISKHKKTKRIGGDDVTRLRDRAVMFRGYPKEVRTDNGLEFTCRAFMTWTQKHGIKHILIEPGSQPRMRTSRASTALSAMNAWMRTGSSRWSRPARALPHGEPTTTGSGHTAAAGVCRLQPSPH